MHSAQVVERNVQKTNAGQIVGGVHKRCRETFVKANYILSVS